MSASLLKAQAADVAGGESGAAGEEWTRIIQPARAWAPLDLPALWAYRQLLYFLAWRDVKVRYKQTVFGAAWAIFKPFMSMVIFSAVFGYFAHFSSDGGPYPVFSYAALLPWTLFSTIVGQSSSSLVVNANLISKVYFPRLLVPAATSLVALLDFALAFVVLIGMMLFFHVGFTLSFAAIPLLAILAILVALSVGIWCAAASVRYRDVAQIVPFLLQLWLYATPVVYPVSMIHGPLRVVLALNPMTGVIEAFRWAILGTRGLDWTTLSVSASVSVAVLVTGIFYFRRVEQTFADVV